MTGELVSHYTDLGGLVGILTSGQFWASNVSFLNDREELLFGLEVLTEELRTLVDDKRSEVAFGRAIESLKGGNLAGVYAVCFCENHDDLTLWRGYGTGYQNVSISFFRSRMYQRHGEPSAGTFEPVSYGREDGSSKLFERFRKDIWQSRFRRRSEEELSRFILSEVGRLAAGIKHQGFCDEKEWRLIYIRHNLDQVEFRPRQNVLVPYIRIGSHIPIEARANLNIHRITIGPGPDPELTASSVQLLLRKVGLQVPLFVSDVPFRS